MTIVHLGEIQGGKQGQRIVDVTQEWLRTFLSLGISNIEDECNNVSKKYRSIWNLRNKTDLMDEYGLHLTFEDGLSELESTF